MPNTARRRRFNGMDVTQWSGSDTHQIGIQGDDEKIVVAGHDKPWHHTAWDFMLQTDLASSHTTYPDEYGNPASLVHRPQPIEYRDHRFGLPDLQVKTAYYTQQQPCSAQPQPVSDEELEDKAGAVFDAADDNWSRRATPDQGDTRGELAFETRYAGDLAILEIEPTDFGGFAVSHRCRGAVIFAGSIVWMGRGKQLYPANPLPSVALLRRSNSIAPPQRIDVTSGPAAPPADEKSRLAA